ncbi:hypothetical protein BDR03DRAFT_281057 [Suillus americanus]|nr:hypothetical protein BDR03DRAFT_281057 [Suillus americanus]
MKFPSSRTWWLSPRLGPELPEPYSLEVLIATGRHMMYLRYVQGLSVRSFFFLYLVISSRAPLHLYSQPNFAHSGGFDILPHFATSEITFEMQFRASDVPGLAWPESPGLGLASEGSGLVKTQARPTLRALAWLGLGSGLGL